MSEQPETPEPSHAELSAQIAELQASHDRILAQLAELADKVMPAVDKLVGHPMMRLLGGGK